MKKALLLILMASFMFMMIACEEKTGNQETSAPPPDAGTHESVASGSVPVKGMVTMIDLGADSCVPCKMMAPILVELEKEYQGKAAIVFLDVWKDKSPAKRFGIRAIPTQIFFDKDGNEVYRHVGFMSKDDIVAQLKRMGVQ
jgi:thioredoxin 1